MQIYLLKLLFQAMNRPIVSLIFSFFHILDDVASPVASDSGNVTPLLFNRSIDGRSCIVSEDGVVQSTCSLAYGESEGAADAHFADQLVLNRFESGRVIPYFAVADPDLAV